MGGRECVSRCFALMSEISDCNKSSFPAKEQESGTVTSLQTGREARWRHLSKIKATALDIQYHQGGEWLATVVFRCRTMTQKRTASVIKNCLIHELGQYVLQVTSPQIPDLHITEPVCDYTEAGGCQEAWFHRRSKASSGHLFETTLRWSFWKTSKAALRSKGQTKLIWV